MKKQLLAAMIVGATALTALPAMAENMYAGAWLGQSKWDPNIDTGGASEDDTDTFFAVGAGFQFSEFVAVEVGYNDFGEYSASGGGAKLTIDGTSFSVAAAGTYPFGNGFSALGKIGFERWDSKAKASAGAFSGSESDNGVDPFYVIGASYDLTETAAARLEYQFHKFKADYGGDKVDSKVNVLAIGFTFGF